MNDPYWPSTPAPGAWRQEAACRGADPDLFFPDIGERSSEARAICGTCPVIEDCRSYARSQPLLYGIWAGEGVAARRNRRWR